MGRGRALIAIERRRKKTKTKGGKRKGWHRSPGELAWCRRGWQPQTQRPSRDLAWSLTLTPASSTPLAYQVMMGTHWHLGGHMACSAHYCTCTDQALGGRFVVMRVAEIGSN